MMIFPSHFSFIALLLRVRFHLWRLDRNSIPTDPIPVVLVCNRKNETFVCLDIEWERHCAWSKQWTWRESEARRGKEGILWKKCHVKKDTPHVVRIHHSPWMNPIHIYGYVSRFFDHARHVPTESLSLKRSTVRSVTADRKAEINRVNIGRLSTCILCVLSGHKKGNRIKRSFVAAVPLSSNEIWEGRK